MNDDKKTAKKAEVKAEPKQTGMTPEQAKELGLDPYPYGGK